MSPQTEPREIPGFVLTGSVRSKKTSQKIILIPSKGAKRCRACGHMPGFPKIIPSDAHATWHASAMQQCLTIKATLRTRGVALPIAGLVSIRALFYRDANRGDATGLYESLADLLQDAQILANDSQIEDWDGSRRLIDRLNPRVEVYITIVRSTAMQMPLIEEQGYG